MRPRPRRADQRGARTSLSLAFCAAVIVFVCGFGEAAEAPQIVVARDLQAPPTSADRGVVALPPAPGRSIGVLVSAPLNVRSETAITVESPDESISAFSPPLLSDTVALLRGFDGGTGTLSPADIGGAVGRGFVVSALNGAYYIFDKTGMQLLAIDGRAFWCSGSLAGCPNINVDPRIVYDFRSGRWITSALVGGGSSAVTTWLAVSKSADPRGTWYLYAFPSCGSHYSTDEGDQPGLGVNSLWIVVKDRSCHGINTHEETLHVFDKRQLYLGAALQVGVNQFEFADQYDLDMPATTFAGRTINNREYLAASNLVSDGTIQVIYSQLEGPVDAPILYQPTESVTLSITGSGVVPLGFQPGCSAPCIGSADDARINSLSVSEGANGHKYIVTTFAVGEPLNNPTTSTVVVVATDTKTRMTVSHGIAAFSSHVYAYPSVALLSNTNRAAVAYSDFSMSKNPVAEQNGWFIDANTISPPKMFAQSSFAYTFNDRWGDFSTTVLDPADPRVIWTAQDYDPRGFDFQDAWWQKLCLIRCKD